MTIDAASLYSEDFNWRMSVTVTQVPIKTYTLTMKPLLNGKKSFEILLFKTNERQKMEDAIQKIRGEYLRFYEHSIVDNMGMPYSPYVNDMTKTVAYVDGNGKSSPFFTLKVRTTYKTIISDK